MKKFLESHIFGSIVVVLVLCILLGAAFEVGVWVGFHKASFSYELGDNFHRVFGERGFRAPGAEFAEGFGVSGKVLKVSMPTVVIEGRDNVEHSVIIGPETIIREFRDTGTTTDLSVDDEIIVIGSPNAQGEIQAKLVRIIPPLSPQATSTQR